MKIDFGELSKFHDVPQLKLWMHYYPHLLLSVGLAYLPNKGILMLRLCTTPDDKDLVEHIQSQLQDVWLGKDWPSDWRELDKHRSGSAQDSHQQLEVQHAMVLPTEKENKSMNIYKDNIMKKMI
ncbi:hypothetical protein DFS33DRAFT_1271189 [Desarmillaria ectypa]|nr:hypothetical protein DFS33DRAFT_1271189 [Desarmillaria ectypa]